MKSVFFFITFILIIYGGACFYIYMRLRCTMPLYNSGWGIAMRIIYVALCACFFVGAFLSRKNLIIAQPFVTTGNWLLAAILYLFIIFLVIDIARIINLLTFKAEWLTFKYQYNNSKAELFAIISGIVCAIILLAGYFNAQNPVRKEIKLTTQKQIEQPFKFVLLSDIHLGMMNGDRFFAKLVARINAENPDFVIIAGDFFDGDPRPVLYSHADTLLRSIQTRYGIYAVTGNHEYIGDVYTATEFLKKNGVNVLIDSTATLPIGVAIVGRNDISNRSKIKRKSISKLITNVNQNNYLINVDHQPAHLEEAEQSNIDLQLSGHTHHGQMWPINFITSAIYECSFGKHQRGNTHYYVSSGYGTWGPPIRTSCRPEMVVFNIEK